ncbi:MAG: alcohol dehydrogenase catalytic domain-containing protein, partial [Candidatus Scalindua sp.]|nr:alcohol dehydrogenase catalytic domain-containing protein [Candidatus Scalindua sp.]MCR4344059.1 alcohol dehydrogenase catalytic domain-containing protein [Candidatus Scalindua sp.]
MKAMILKKLGSISENKTPLELADLPDPVPGEAEILVRVSACGVCHTELDEIEGRTPPPNLPVIPGHQVVGIVEQIGGKAGTFAIGDRVGVGWIHSSCGRCKFCLEGNENLCHEFKATGRDVNGGYAQYMTVTDRFAFRIPDTFSFSEAAPLLCAGAIGYRSLELSGLKDGQNLGLTGFGASAHLVLQMVRHRFAKSKIYVFARSEGEREFARELGAVWTGATEEDSPEKLDCIIDTTPVWKPVLEALRNL